MYVSVNSARKSMSTCTRNEAEKIGELQRHVTVKSDPVLQRTEELVDNGVVRGKEKRTKSPFLQPTLMCTRLSAEGEHRRLKPSV